MKYKTKKINHCLLCKNKNIKEIFSLPIQSDPDLKYGEIKNNPGNKNFILLFPILSFVFKIK